MRKLILLLMFSALLGSTLAQESAWSPAQEEVWNREETYWKVILARDVKGYLELWDDTFVGWPFYQKSPVGKSAFQAQPFGIKGRVVSSYEFDQKVVQLHGNDIAITYLQLYMKQTLDGQKAEPVIRLTHTWQKRDGVWRIVGGMSCVVKPDGLC